MADTVAPTAPASWVERLRPKSLSRAVTTLLLFVGAWVMGVPFFWLFSSILNATVVVYVIVFSFIPN